MRLNLNVDVNLRMSMKLDDAETRFVQEHRANIENKIRNMIFEEFGNEYEGDDGYQEVTIHIYQNELTDV